MSKDGIFFKIFYFTNPDNIVTTIFDLNDYANHNANTDEDADDDQIYEPAFSLNQDTVFELITFVGMWSPHNAFEPFFIVELVSKGIGLEAFSDDNLLKYVTHRNEMKKEKLLDISGQKSSWAFIFTLLKYLLQTLHYIGPKLPISVCPSCSISQEL